MTKAQLEAKILKLEAELIEAEITSDEESQAIINLFKEVTNVRAELLKRSSEYTLLAATTLEMIEITKAASNMTRRVLGLTGGNQND